MPRNGWGIGAPAALDAESIPPTEPSTSRARWAVVVVAALSLLQYRVTILVHGGHFEQIARATEAVLAGHPHWRSYQSRVLGPALVALGDVLTGVGYELALLVAMMVLPLVQNLVLFFLLRRLSGDDRAALTHTVFFATAFLLLQDALWLFVWDYLDLIVFTVFLYGVLAGRGIAFFLVVFGVGVLNRESALVIGVWMILDALVVGSRPGELRPGLRDRRRLVAGVGVVVAGSAAIELIRRTLFVASAAEAAGIVPVPLGPLGTTRLAYNVGLMADSLTQPSPLLPVAVTAAAILAPLWVVSRLSRFDRRLLTVALTFLAAWAVNLVVGVVQESRVHIWLIPFLVYLHFGLTTTIDRDAARRVPSTP